MLVEANYAVGWPDSTHAIMRERSVGHTMGAYAEDRAPDAPKCTGGPRLAGGGDGGGYIGVGQPVWNCLFQAYKVGAGVEKMEPERL